MATSVSCRLKKIYVAVFLRSGNFIFTENKKPKIMSFAVVFSSTLISLKFA